jgi:hypothetical protein
MAEDGDRDGNGDPLSEFLQSKLQAAGRQYAEARRAYSRAKAEALVDVATDEEGRARIVCRRYAEQRAVDLDGDGRPSCYEDHPDCEGCVEDISEGVVETW